MPDKSFLGRGWGFPPGFTAGGAQVEMVADTEDIHQSLQILLSTQLGERLMQEDYGEKVDETGHYYLDRMQDAAARMSGLITDLLAYSRVTTKVRPFGRVDLNAVVADVLSDLEMQIEETNGRIILSNLPAIEADATQMHQLLQNFIGNALKFHQADVPPVVELIGHLEQKRARGGDAPQAVCRLEVRDNGIGFDDEYVEKIFTIFQRLHGRTEYNGTGVGLAICRKIVERHGGTINAKGIVDHGATFKITLPIKHSEINVPKQELAA